MEFKLEYVELEDGTEPAVDFILAQDDKAQAKIFFLLERLAFYGTRMPGKLVKKLTASIFELRVKHFDRIFRVLFFYSAGQLIVVTSAFQKKGQKTPKAEMRKAERLRTAWLRARR